ncbi:GLRA1-like protein [Mya arenaria]|uniref:GLRA1-like protein n=1 Tax=Mya arenaria TaxID=6604 RepID=A0ABY7DNF1_MYAAR|nr:GLRA1-like protein [Mya arenaria]
MDFTVDLKLHLTWKNPHIINNFKSIKVDFDYLDFDAQNMQKGRRDVELPNELTEVSVRQAVGYTVDKLVLHWGEGEEKAVVTDNVKEMRQFRMVHTHWSNFTRTHNITGNHSCLQADFHLVRNIGYYVIQMYVPSLLIVMLSWLSFWLNVNSIPGRVTLGVLSVLTISTQSTSVNASLPRVSYTKAIDVWMITCLVFVFAALIEFAVVNVLAQKVPGRRFSLATLFLAQKEGGEEKETAVDQDGRVTVEARQSPHSRILLCSRYLDIASRVLFPVAFAIFNMIYWIYFLNVTEY